MCVIYKLLNTIKGGQLSPTNNTNQNQNSRPNYQFFHFNQQQQQQQFNNSNINYINCNNEVNQEINENNVNQNMVNNGKNTNVMDIKNLLCTSNYEIIELEASQFKESQDEKEDLVISTVESLSLSSSTSSIPTTTTSTTKTSNEKDFNQEEQLLYQSKQNIPISPEREVKIDIVNLNRQIADQVDLQQQQQQEEVIVVKEKKFEKENRDNECIINRLPNMILKIILALYHCGKFPSFPALQLMLVCKLWRSLTLCSIRYFSHMMLWCEKNDSELEKWMSRVSSWVDHVYGLESHRCCLETLKLNIGLTSKSIPQIVNNMMKYGNNLLIDMDLSGNRIDSEGAILLASLIEKDMLSSLSLAKNKVGDEGVLAIAKALEVTSTLKKLDLSGNQFSRPAMKALFQSLKGKNESVIDLNIADSLLGDTDIDIPTPEELAKLHSKPPLLTRLNISSTASGRNIEILLSCIQLNLSLKTLIMNNNFIRSSGCKILSEKMNSADCLLEELSINDNQIGDGGVLELSKLFKNNISLKKLSIANCKITFAGVSHLCHALLGPNVVLEDLDLSDNPLRAQSTPYISYLLSQIPCSRTSCLKHLRLRYCQLGDEGIGLLIKSLESNNTLVTLDVNGNHITSAGCVVLAETLRRPQSSLTTLLMGNNSIGNEGIAVIADALKTNKTLTSIDLENNGINFIGTLPLIEALRVNHTLIDINLYVVSVPRNLRLFLKVSK